MTNDGGGVILELPAAKSATKVTTLKKLKCKFCDDEFDIHGFGNLYFHVRSAHMRQYWQKIAPGVAAMNDKIRLYEYAANEGMKGYRETILVGNRSYE